LDMAECTVAAAADDGTRDALSDDECDDDDDDDGDLRADKDNMQTGDKQQQSQYNAYICSKIDDTWVSGRLRYRRLLLLTDTFVMNIKYN